MPVVIPSRFAEAKLAEKIAWQRYAAAKDDNWREALAKWVEARDETTPSVGELIFLTYADPR